MRKNDNKRKGISLKASSFSIQEESDKEDLNEIEEDDDFNFFVKRFNKFLGINLLVSYFFFKIIWIQILQSLPLGMLWDNWLRN